MSLKKRLNNMKNDVDSIQINFQEIKAQNIHMLDILTKMVEYQEQQQSYITSQEDFYLSQEIQIQYPDSIFMNDS
jgi:hypothetical protein